MCLFPELSGTEIVFRPLERQSLETTSNRESLCCGQDFFEHCSLRIVVPHVTHRESEGMLDQEGS